MILHNPTDNDIKIVFQGSEFMVAANSDTELENEVANYWLGIHAFLRVVDSTEEVQAPTAKKAVKETSTKK